MPRISTVGSGHGAPDYATLAAWWAAESSVDYSGLPIIAECLGNCGDNFTLSGTSVNGAEIYTQGVTYDGANQSSLAVITRLDLAADIYIHDISLQSDNNFDFILELDAGCNGATIERCYLYHSGTPSGVDAIVPNASLTDVQILNCVIDCNGCVNGIDFGFNFALDVRNNIIFGATGDGLEGSGDSASLIIQNNFCFNNGASDYSNIGASATFTNNASEDLTGQETGYTSSELVDFAGGDYRTKSASALATLGTGGSFIGAFLEAGGGPTYSLTLDAGSYSLTGSDVVLAANRIIALDAGSYVYTGQDVALSVSRKIALDAGNYTYTGSDVNIKASRKLTLDAGNYAYTGSNVTLTYTPTGGATYTITLDAGSYALSGNDVALKASRKLTLDAAAYSLTGNDLSLAAGRAISLDAGGYTYTGNAITLKASRAIALDAGGYTYTGFPVSLTYSGVVISLISDYSVQYAQDPLTVSYEADYISAEFN